jgi:hypothetical protein
MGPKASVSILVETLILVVVEEKWRAAMCCRAGEGDLESGLPGDAPINQAGEGCLIITALVDSADLACGSRSGPRVKQRSFDVTGRIMAAVQEAAFFAEGARFLCQLHFLR